MTDQEYQEAVRLEFIWREMLGYWAMTLGMTVAACAGMVLL